MGKASLHPEHRTALENVKTLWRNKDSHDITCALGAQLKIFSAGYTQGINDRERELLFEIVDEYVDNPIIVYYCMLALKCNIRQGIDFMAESVSLGKMCNSISSVCLKHRKDIEIVNLMASIVAELTRDEKAVIPLLQNGFQNTCVDMMKTAMTQKEVATQKNMGLMWCSRILNNMYVWGFRSENFIDVLIDGMKSTSDYWTFEDIIQTILNIYQHMTDKEPLHKYLNGIKFETHLCAQLAKYQHYDIEHFKRSYGETLFDMDLANVKGVSRPNMGP